MPKRKLTVNEQIERYQRKLRKLQFIPSSSEEDSDKDDLEEVPMLDDGIGLAEVEIAASPNQLLQQNEGTDLPAPAPAELAEPTAGPSAPPVSEPEQVPPQLDPELLSALGDATDESPKWGPKIHDTLAQRWLPILRKGLTKEKKENMVKEYLVPENCTLLQAPRLNPEISAAVTEMSRNRDKKIENEQQQLGIGITAVNRAISVLLNSDDKVTAIKLLSDSCRILADLHYLVTQSRTKLITPGLAKSFLTVIRDTERDDMLFGNKLHDKIKASKAIEKQGLQIKKPVVNMKSTMGSTSTTTPRSNFQYQGNWSGPSRYPSNRGGRGGQRKTAATTRKPQAQPQSRPAGQAKPHAPTPQ